MARPVNALAERWPRLEQIPRLPLARLPTPVHALSAIAKRLDAGVWIKRDDLSAPRYGGNKVRKLEFLLAEAQREGADTLLTMGAVGSHFVFATALYGREQGFAVHAVLTPQPYQRHVEEQLRADLAIGATLYPAVSARKAAQKLLELSLRARLEGRRPKLLPLGGSSVTGSLAYVQAGVELAQQIDAGECPDPAAVYVPCGSCATAAGLALGLAAAGVRTNVIAVRVADRLFANRLQLTRLVRGAQVLLRSLDVRFPDVAEVALRSLVLSDEEFGRGYGVTTPVSEAATHVAESEGIRLDAAYTSKTFARLLLDADTKRRGQNLLFWNTLSSASMEPFLVQQPEAPEQFVRLMTLEGA
jgi:1-aminocyclopropane-1-carboxylate deaminase/D-cysteine desulfhydrase-like pyridoxal-dependent ACC family enzyme